MKRFKELIRRLLRGPWADQRTYYTVFVAVLLVPNLFLCVTEPMPWLGKAALLLVPGGVWMGLFALARRPGLPLWCLLPVLVFGAFQLVLLYLFGNSIIAVDMLLNVATTNSGEAMELLGKLVPAIVGVVALYVPTLILGVVSARLPDRLSDAFRRRSLWRAAFVLLVGGGAMVGARIQDPAYRAKYDLWPLNIAYNFTQAVDRWQRTARYAETSRDFRFEARSERPDTLREVYVLVVGETSRALNWQLYGYDRPTTPLLMQEPGLVCFRDMLTQANATHKSVPIMLSAASAEDYDVIYTHKSILTAFREAGFRTAFFSNQRPNGSFIDHFGAEADTTLFLKAPATPGEAAAEPYDEELLRAVDALLTDTSSGRGDSRKLFIVLHTYGSHFDYQERYPAREAYFRPAVYESVGPDLRDRLVNAYDNSIRDTDRFLSRLIGRLRALPNTASAMLYASDHGEDLYDDRRNLFLHASPIPTYYQLHIPCVVWFSADYDTLRPEARAAARANARKPMTTNVVFHTMLDLGGIETPYRNDSLAVSSASFRVRPRHFLNDHNRPEPLDRLGLRSPDIDMFRRMGLDFPAR